MITGSSPAQVVANLRQHVQQALDCVTPTVVQREEVPAPGLVAEALLAGSERYALLLRLRYLVLSQPEASRGDRWEARTTSYVYKLDAADGREILAYHWHPTGVSHERRPHLHISAGYGDLHPRLQKAHLLTGAVSPAALLELCVTSLGVAPRRPDWSRAFERMAVALQLGEPAS